MKTRTVFIGCVFILLGVSFAFSQTQAAPAKPLLLKKALSDSLAPKASHVYTLPLAAGQFVYGEVNQITVDVVVKILGPDGTLMKTIDGPARGAEPFQFDSKAAGVYRVEVAPFEEQSGRYSIELKLSAPTAKDPAKRVGQLMAAFSRTDVPGGAVAVVQNGKILFSKAYGMANLTYGVPFTTGTLNNIGSTSKQFTAFAIAMLAKQGKFSLDDDVRKHIPELPDLGKTVTLRHLLTHTSGYREFLNFLALGGLNMAEGDYIDRGEIIEIVKNQPELQNDPGAEFNYNNTGFCLLAMVVERVTKQKFPEWMQENVFKPAGMDHTMIRAYPRQVIPNGSTGYLPNREGGYDEGRDIAASTGAGGIYSTVGDLARWITNFHTGKVGGKDIIDQMFTRFVHTKGDTSAYGLGLFVEKHRGLRRVQHGGADMAHRSMLMYYPDIDAGIITQSNNTSIPADLANEIAVAFFEKYMKPEAPQRKDQKGAAFNPAEYDPQKFDELAGRYELKEMPGFILTFSREDKKFYVEATRQPKVEMVPTSDSTFKILVVNASITFHRTPESKVESLTLHQNGDHPASRLQAEPWKPSPEELKGYTGRFYSGELEIFYTLAVEDSALAIQRRRMPDIRLVPAKIDNFTAGNTLSDLVFIRDEKGEITALKVSNGRTRGVKFEKAAN